MSIAARWMLAASVLGLSPNLADGQAVPGVPIVMPGAPGGQNPVLILLAPAVQKELRLDDAQKGRVLQVAQESAGRSREIARSIQSPTVTPQQYRDAIAWMRLENDRALAKLLSPGQKERLQQIVLRIEGPIAVSRPEVAARVGLTGAQMQQVQIVLKDFQMAQRRIVLAARQAGKADDVSRKAVRSQAAQLREAANRDLTNLLDPKQRDAFNALLGEGFDLSRIDPDLPPTPSGGSTARTATAPGPARRNPGR